MFKPPFSLKMEQPLTVVLVQPPHHHSLRTANSPPYNGVREARHTTLRGLLRCSGLQRLVVLAARRDLAPWQSLLDEQTPGQGGPVEVVDLNRLASLPASAPVVLVTTLTDLTPALHVRQVLDRPDWPVSGMTHDLSDPEVFQRLVLAHASGLRPGDSIICCSRAAMNAMKRLSAHACSLTRTDDVLQFPVVPHGLDLATCPRHDRRRSRAEIGMQQDACMILYFGRIHHGSKADLHGLIGTFANTTLPFAQLVIAGGAGPRDEDYLRELRQLAKLSGAGAAIHFFTNPEPAVKQRLFSAADIFVSPANSLQESFGLTLLEAMAYGLPVVATDWSGYRDIVVDRVTGYLTPTAFEPDARQAFRELPIGGRADFHSALSEQVQIDLDALSQQLRTLCTDHDLRERLGAEGAKRLARQFLLDDVIQRYQAVWRQMREVATAIPTPDRGVPPCSIPPCVDFLDVFSGHASNDCHSEHELNVT